MRKPAPAPRPAPTNPGATAPLDAVIVGAGPAGLTAAIYLARFHRSFAVLHDGRSRARWIPRTHNHPGFPGGVKGTTLLGRMRRQAESFGAAIREGRVERVTRGGDGVFTLSGEGISLRARTVLLATGVHDNRPPLRGIETAMRRAVVRICPICDAYEVTGKRIAVVGDSELAAREGQFLRRYSDAVTVINVAGPEALSAETQQGLAAAGIRLVDAALTEIALRPDGVDLTASGDRPVLAFDTLYAALGCAARNELAEAAGVEVSELGYLVAGQEHQETAVPGLYAAGDVVRGLNQISVAQAEAAIAATAMHNWLREQDGEK